jgi:hypothetical protein
MAARYCIYVLETLFMSEKSNETFSCSHAGACSPSAACRPASWSPVEAYRQGKMFQRRLIAFQQLLHVFQLDRIVHPYVLKTFHYKRAIHSQRAPWIGRSLSVTVPPSVSLIKFARFFCSRPGFSRVITQIEESLTRK